MSEDKIRFSIPLDEEGYISLECPFCGEEFKILGSDFEEEENFQLFCPYCGLIDEKSSFLSKDAITHVTTLAENHMNEMLNKTFKNIEKDSRNNKFVKFKVTKELKSEEPKKLIAVNDLIEKEMKCCNKNIKVFSEQMGIFCPFCGVK